MIRPKLTIAAATAFALSFSPVWADQRSRPAGSESTGSAQPRGGGDSSAPSSSGSSSPSGSSSSRGSAGDSSGSSGSWMGGSSSSYQPVRAPERPARAEQRDRGGAPSSGTATPRGSSGGGGSSDGGASTRGSGGTSSSAGSNDNSERSRAPVPTYSRPRDGRNPQGTAVDRRNPAPGSGGGSVYYPGVIYDPYYYRYGYYDPYFSNRFTSYWSPFGYGYGLGYFAYDPYMYGGGYPSGYGGYGYDSYGGYGTSQRYGETGSLRLKVKPSHAQVHIDGYYVGVVDSYDGVFQKLNIEAGPHRIELRAEGYETAQFDVMVVPGETMTYKGDMKRIP
jgi:hypothetical protein